MVTTRGVASRLLGVGKEAHEVVLRLLDVVEDPVAGVNRTERAQVQEVIASLQSDQVEAIPWHEVQPMIAELLRMQGAWMGLMMGLVFFVIAFVIVGTMSMALLERTWEFGLLRALGTSPSAIAALILAEAGWLGALGGGVGMILGHLVNVCLAHIGIDLSDVEFVVTFDEPIRPVADLPVAFALAMSFVLLTILVSAVAAFRATRIPPGIALRQR
ncbi:MAG TPA: hypothetical protein DCQ06_13790 [Myxococcales bacterium]|nr:hypothetical protein [Myxococcales bacterium]